MAEVLLLVSLLSPIISMKIMFCEELLILKGIGILENVSEGFAVILLKGSSITGILILGNTLMILFFTIFIMGCSLLNFMLYSSKYL